MDTNSTLALLDAEPFEVRNAFLSAVIDKAFAGDETTFLTSLVDSNNAEDWRSVAHYINAQEGARDMDKYLELCFLYACFILCFEGEVDSF